MLPPTSAKASAPDTTKTAFDNVRTGRTVEVQVASDAVAAGTMYYIGHNENFGNYRSTDPDFVTRTGHHPRRLRIGLAHSANETDDRRDDVDFEACRIRITDADGGR